MLKKTNNTPSQMGATASNDNDNDKVFKRYTNIFGNLSLVLYHSSITECDLSIEAVTNCTGSRLEAVGGISKALVKACGPKLEAALRESLKSEGDLKPGMVRATPAFNLTNQRHIFHVFSPSLRRRYELVDNTLVSLLSLTYKNLMQLGFGRFNLESLATPLIGTGLAGIPVEESLNDLLDAMHSLASEFDTPRTLFVVNNDRSVVQCLSLIVEEKLAILGLEPAPANEDAPNTAEQSFQSDDDECVICMDKINASNFKKLDLCGHKFCRECIDEYFRRVKQVCPICQRVYGVMNGSQPDGGQMNSKVLNMSLPGYESARTIEIVYSIPSGVQQAEHPNPGRRYQGCVRTAYLPDTDEGRRVLELLRIAFKRKLIFTIGQSRTTGAEDCVTWNDIHHKTSIKGGPTAFGYPDANYLNRVLSELAAKGIQ